MLFARISRLVGALFLWGGGSATAATVNIDIQKKYGTVSLSAINHAIGEARAHFAANPNDIVILHVPAGVFSLAAGADADSSPSIDVSDVTPGPGGQLVLRGAGKGQTTLVFTMGHDEIVGHNAHRVSFIGLHFTVDHMTASQGHVAQVLPDAVILRLEDGFPTPADIGDAQAPKGAWLRRFTDSATDPHLEPDNNEQVHWWRAVPVAPRVWRFDLNQGTENAALSVGDLVAIKEKPVGGGTFRFSESSDLTFDDVEWTRATRGVFRHGTYNVKILNSSIERGPPVEGHVPALASSGGGPQFGQPRDPPMTGIVVSNFTANGTGDDALAFFNASGTVDRVTIADSFARGILLFRSEGVVLSNVQVARAPILHATERAHGSRRGLPE
jgi:hypothetical protein